MHSIWEKNKSITSIYQARGTNPYVELKKPAETTTNIANNCPLSPSASASHTEARPRVSFRRTRSPPRNSSGEITCDHLSCSSLPSPPTFKRPCEWNRHMDRHDRPYKCHEPGCESNPGFTYSGGLPRHQREVHKMNLSTRKPLFCSFKNCDRSAGAGFMRKKNLEEHKRRRHLGQLAKIHQPTDADANGRPDNSSQTLRKRKATALSRPQTTRTTNPIPNSILRTQEP